MLKLRYRRTTENLGEKWDYCVLCGPQSTRCVLYFDSGSTAPTAGETVTGATSSDTGVVETYEITSGSWSAGTAAGVIVLTTLTGSNIGQKPDGSASYVFTNNELLNGSTAGSNFATADGNGGVSRTGVMYPEGDLVTYEGRRYCKPHFEFRYRNELYDREISSINEGDRGT